MHLREEVIEISQPLQAAIAVCREDIDSKRLEMKVQTTAAQSHVMGDPVRLQQVFWNLLRNAIKFTDQGGQISAIIREGKTGFVAVEIADTGMGIDPQRLGKIFEAFEQGGREIQIRFGGLGLGLAICQALAEAHHGTVAAHSAGKGKGATFTVELPVVVRAAMDTQVAENQPISRAAPHFEMKKLPSNSA